VNAPDLRAAALAYASLGWAVVPLHEPTAHGCTCYAGPECRTAGKHPRTEHGVREASTDADAIVRWWTRWPTANVGIATGLPSGVVVLDLDPRNGSEETIETFAGLGQTLSPTVEALTGGGGSHRFYRHPRLAAGLEVWNTTIGAGVEVKATGLLVVAEPSLHPSGRRYAWETSAHPLDGTELAELPTWIYFRCVRPTGGRTGPRGEPLAHGELEASLLARAFKLAGLVRRRIDSTRVAVRCPWEREHTSHGVTSTVLFAPVEGRSLGWFHCSHGHCSGRGAREALDALPRELVERARRELAEEERERNARAIREATDRLARGEPLHATAEPTPPPAVEACAEPEPGDVERAAIQNEGTV